MRTGRFLAITLLSLAYVTLWFISELLHHEDMAKWLANRRRHSKQHGFTLLEISVVLVIIGLIVGGILVGQHLIRAAEVRATVSQIEKYQAAVATFREKFGALPGDIPDPGASSFGFQPRGQFAGEGDGNGILEGNCPNTAGSNNGTYVGCGELAVFWNDLSIAGLIDANIFGRDTHGGGYPSTTLASTVYLTTHPGVLQWLPAAKLGQGNFIYVL